MTNSEILTHLKAGQSLNFGCNSRNSDVMELMADLERKGLIETEDASLSQETRRIARWVK